MLSEQQKRVLRWLLRVVRDLEDRNDRAARSLLVEGIVWRPRAGDKESENSWRASLCGTLARMEQRGLITRIRGRKNARTVRVMFTDLGRRVADSIGR